MCETKMLKRIALLIFSCFVFLVLPMRSGAVVTIDVTGGVESGIPIAVVPFEWLGNGMPPEDFRNIIASNLDRSGRFDVLPVEDYLSRPSNAEQVRYKDWRLIKAEALVVGNIRPLKNNRFEVKAFLFDVFSEKRLTGIRRVFDLKTFRKNAHVISDKIFYELLGKEGAFDSRIAYVTVEQIASKGTIHRLMVADSDGHNPQELVESSDPILSPSWHPKGRYLAYVSFENAKKDLTTKIFLHDIFSGKREKLYEAEGTNQAPAWSPDGKKIAISLSIDGNSEIVVIDLKSRRLQRITNNIAIDTSPAWAPNSRSLVFTSDRSGRPQIYRVPAAGGKAVRITFDGRENLRPSYSPDGKNLLMVTKARNGHQIGVFSMFDKNLRILTSGPFDESPTFAPNGSMVLYATKRGGRQVMEIISVYGGAREVLRFPGGSMQSPAWSPLNQ
ncbi:MAG: Tol-Pal system beta propeller repeat protein TolB [Acidiferrobacteraceae bacterium]|nr:Tol-Pal system beta propeller repeat protein TolB [Acidiferrobacteraceae bacterium]